MSTNLSPRLHAHVASVRASTPAAAADAAQRKLDTRLAGAAAPRQHPWIGWMAAAATACMVLAITLLPTSRGIAFDVVQKHLRDFSTLTFVIDQRSHGEELPGIRVRMNRQGDVRTDLGTATSTIVSPRQHAMLMLLHDVHQAMPMPLGTAAGSAEDRFAWLDAIRDFQGEATRLPGTRVIDGRVTTGWTLDTHGMHISLWADAEGLPLAVEINGGDVLSQRMHVTLDAPIDPAVFSTRVPTGYRVMGPDED